MLSSIVRRAWGWVVGAGFIGVAAASGCGGSSDVVLAPDDAGAVDALPIDAAPPLVDATLADTAPPVFDSGVAADAAQGADAAPVDGAADAFSCSPPAVACGASCVDTRWDPANCGGCGQACPPSQLCSNGGCSLSCLGGTAQCGAICADLRDDPSNCGGCGLRCGPAAACVSSSCVTLAPDAGVFDAAPPCTVPQISCFGVCVDPRVDSQHCGNCSTVCPSGEICTSGVCACPGATARCGNACVDLTTDPANCGVCGAACSVRQVCSGGACVCAPGATLCNGACVDATIDSTNCGGCGVVCPAGSVCTDGQCAAPVGSWQMFGHDAQHTGQNADETGSPPAVTQWERLIVSPAYALSPATVEGGRAFVTYSSRFYGSKMFAVNVSDGSLLWSYDFGPVESLGHPSVVDGKVFVETNKGTTGSSYLWCLDATTGTVIWASIFGSQWEFFWAPIVVNGVVYMDGGVYGGLYAFKVLDGGQLFFDGSVGQFDSWSPAFFGGNVFTFVASSAGQAALTAYDPTTGAQSWSASVSWNWTGYSMNTAPVLAAGKGYVIAPPNLYAIDTTLHAVSWTAGGQYAGAPAVANGVVYGVSAGTLIARDATSGALQWTFVGDRALDHPPVIANGYAYVSSDANVYAVDLTTHAQAWTARGGGWLSIASRRLLVAGNDGVLRGFVLSK